MTTSSAVVLCTHQEDHYVPELVMDALRSRGVSSYRLHTDAYPEGLRVSDHLSAAGTRVTLGPLASATAPRAIWRRRVWPARTSSAPGGLGFASMQQARVVFEDAIDALAADGVPVINGADVERAAEHKPRQLRLARALGFPIPDTITSNDAAAARAFVDRIRGEGDEVITKLVAPLSSTMDGSGPFVYSTTLTDDDVAALDDDSLALCPQVFQRRVKKTHDVRVQVMGDQVTAGAIACEGDDWRKDGHGHCTPLPLSDVDTRRCLALCRRLGLVTGAIDFVVDRRRGDALVFLEVNPAGEWGFLQRDLGPVTGVDLAGQLADCLLAGGVA